MVQHRDTTQPDAIETDAEAIAKVRELLLGDALRAIREEVIGNHGILLGRVEKIQNQTHEKIERLGSKLSALSALLEQALAERDESIAGLAAQADQQAQLARTELANLADQFVDASNRLRRDYQTKLERQSAMLHATEQRLLAGMAAQAEQLGTEQSEKEEFARFLRAAATQVATPVRTTSD